MAIGDRTPKRWLQKTLDTNPTNSTVAGAVNVRRWLTAFSVSLKTGSLITRTVSVYTQATGTSNEVMRIVLNPGGTVSQVLTQLPFFVENTQSYFFSQDVGSDVNIEIFGTEEVLA